MSVSSAVPIPATQEAFEALFKPKKPSSRSRPGPAEVIYTLASAVQHLDGNIQQSQQQHQATSQQQQSNDVLAAFNQSHNQDPHSPTQPLDGQPQQTQPSIRVPQHLRLALHELAQRFRPFNVPPAPIPMPDAAVEAEARAAEAAADEGEEMQARQLEAQIERQDRETDQPQTQTVVLTIQESRDLSGRKFFTAHQTPVVRIEDLETTEFEQQQEMQHYQNPDNTARSSLGRVRRGGCRVRSPQRGWRSRKMYALSVRRQRKLKMKRHKYKKLMRRTRNLRRKLDKL